MNNMKKQRKPVEWERLDISSRKLVVSREHFTKERNGKDITEAEEIKKSGKNTQKNYTRKVLMTQITMMVRTLTQSDILECKVKQALGSFTMNKASGEDGIPAELFQILKIYAVKVPSTHYISKFGKLSSGHRTGKGQFSL